MTGLKSRSARMVVNLNRRKTASARDPDAETRPQDEPEYASMVCTGRATRAF